MTTTTGPAGGARSGRRPRTRADLAPAAPPLSGRAARAAAQRESTAHFHERPPSFLQRMSGPVVEFAPTWKTVTSLVLSILGLCVSIYLTVDHFAHVPLACSGNGLVNCQKVTTSAESHFLGIPVALLGLLFFVAMTAINLPAAWRVEDRRLHIARLAMAVVGMCFVLYLVSAELLIIGNICLWCTSVHALTFLLFVLMLATIPPMVGWTGATRATD